VIARYRIEHETRYVYASTVATSQHVAYLRPRELPWQHVVSSGLTITPTPSRVVQRVDYFANLVDHFELLRPHVELRVCARSLVDVHPREGTVTPSASPLWKDARTTLASSAVPPAVSQFVYASPYVPPASEIRAFARGSFPEGRTLLAGAIDLMHRIHRDFTFDPSATNLTTPLTRVLADRRGVCQDFAHFQISCLRSLGLAARYVSGYLLTDPPPGQPRLIGADASHAWLSVYCPHHGWVDLDPTNDVIVAQRHVVLAWGRDYGDVSPLRGVLLGGAEHTLFVGVSVEPVAVGDESVAQA
jgi:transglutaminase-like putative cysteine protease